jgi:hypothetical protein
MIGGALQFFFCATIYFFTAFVAQGELSVGKIYALDFTDIDGNKISTSDGHMTVVVLTTTPDLAKTHVVSDRVPDFCLGNPMYRMITVINFQKKRSAPMRMFFTAIVRHRVDSEAKQLQSRYATRKINKDARRDIFVVTDFSGDVVSQLGHQLQSSTFCAFVFGRSGELLRQWNDVPSAQELAAILK